MAARVTQEHIEVLRINADPPIRVTQEFIEVLRINSDPPIRVTQEFIEVLFKTGDIFEPSVTSTLFLTQQVAVIKTLNISVNQTLTLQQRAGQVFDADAANTLVLSHEATGDVVGNTEVSHQLNLSQQVVVTISRAVSASNFLMLAHQATKTQVFNREADNTLSLSHFAVKTIPEAVNHTLTLSHSVDVVKVKSQGVVQPLLLSHSVTVERTYNRTVSQGLVLSHQAVAKISRLLQVTSTLNLMHSAVGIASKHTSSTLVLSQTVDVQLVKGAKNQLTLTQTVQENHTSNRRLFSNLIPFHTVAVQKTLRRTIAHSLTLTHSATADVVRPTKNQLLLFQEVIVDKVKPAFSELVLTDAVVLNYTKNMLAQSQLFLTHSVQVQKSKAVGATSVLAFEHRAKATKVISRSVSHTLVLNQEVVRDRDVESVEQTLDLDQSVVVQKIAPRSVSQQLTLSHSVQVSKTINRHVQHQLVFKESFLRYIGLPGVPTVDIPGIQVVLVKKQVILEHGQSVIVLPPPEFDDREGGLGKVNIKRAMDGTRRVYKRDQPSSRLVYDFVIDRFKAIELRSFILGNNSNVLRMSNWKGEIWMVVFTNNPFNFIEEGYREGPQGNRSTVTLEFQGVRIN